MPDLRAEAESILRQAFGPSAKFRSGQWEAIESLMSPGKRLLVVQRTGWGKSIVYFLATALNRRREKGMTLLISPLLALMRNQIEMAAKMGVRAASIDSTNQASWAETEAAALAGELDALFVSPERLGNYQFAATLKMLLPEIGLLVVDEAHCISDWGHDFRPDYRRILPLAEELGAETPILATTATATERVIEDVARQLGRKVEVQRGTILRESLAISTFELPNHADRLAWMSKFLPRLEGSGIVYTLTVHDCEQVAEYLRFKGKPAQSYHGAMEHAERLDVETRFASNTLRIIVATSALGMGYDKGDIGFVVHYQLPPSMLAYYQQIGRAGRMLERAHACLLFGEGDLEISEHFAATSVPPKQVFDFVLGELDFEPRDLGKLLKRSSFPFHQISQALELLRIDGVVEERREGLMLKAGGGTFDDSKYRELQELRRQESHDMLAFARSDACRMQSIGRLLGESAPAKCGRCDVCKPRVAIALDPESIREANTFIRSSRYIILPRVMLPAVPGEQKARKIDEALRSEFGAALAIYNDSGFGSLVRQAKYAKGAYSDELVKATAETVRELDFAPEWLTWVPSVSNPNIAAFAAKLAEALEIPSIEAIVKRGTGLPQKAMQHSLAQYMNVRDAFEVKSVLPGRCLLVDDIVDSGWTLALVAMRLREAGSGPVVPFALASSKPRRAR